MVCFQRALVSNNRTTSSGNLGFVEMKRGNLPVVLTTWVVLLINLATACPLQGSRVDPGCTVCSAAPRQMQKCSSNQTWAFSRCDRDQHCINEDQDCNAFCAPGCITLDGAFIKTGRKLCNHNNTAKITCGDDGHWRSESCAAEGVCEWNKGEPRCNCVLPGRTTFGKRGCTLCSGPNELSICQSDGSFQRKLCESNRTCVHVAKCEAQCEQPCENESGYKVRAGCRRCGLDGKSQMICRSDGTWQLSECNSTSRCHILDTCVSECSHQKRNPQSLDICGKYIVVKTESFTCRSIGPINGLTVEEFEILNPNVSCNESLLGKRFCVQAFNPRVHCGLSVLVESNNTCTDLAISHNLSLNHLLTMNPTLQCDALMPGEEVCVKISDVINKAAYAAATDYLEDETIDGDVFSNSEPDKMIYATLISATILILGLFVVIAALAAKNRARNRDMKALELDLLRSNKELDPIAPVFEQLENLQFDGRYELPIECLKIDRKQIKVLGKGHFGRVIEGKMIQSDGSERLVAIKRTRSNWDANQYRMLFEELCLLVTVGSHPNIIPVLGAVTQISKGHLYIVLELCGNGSLLDYISKMGEEKYVNEIVLHQSLGEVYEKQLDIVRQESQLLCTSDLLSFGYQIANGMQWVASRGFIHRDLAARNILLTSDLIVKISDFGLGRQEFYYIDKKSVRLPLRCMAPEAILHRKFSVNSDVWSFGILLGELFSLGCVPFGHINQVDQEFAIRLAKGIIPLPKPQFARQPIHKLIQSCCNPTPKLRCSFEICRERLLAEFQLCNSEKWQKTQAQLQNASKSIAESEKITKIIRGTSKNSKSPLFKLKQWSKKSVATSQQPPVKKSNYVPFLLSKASVQYQPWPPTSANSCLSDTDTDTYI